MNRIEITSFLPDLVTPANNASLSFSLTDQSAFISAIDAGAYSNSELAVVGVNQQTGEECADVTTGLAGPFGSGWPNGYYKICYRQYEISNYNVSAGTSVRTGKYRELTKALLYWNRSPLRFMVYLAPGSYTMGSPTSEIGRGTNENLHKVVLSQGFYIARTVCTNAWFNALTGGSGGDNKPKVYVRYSKYNSDGKIYWDGANYEEANLPTGYVSYPWLYESGTPPSEGGLIAGLNSNATYAITGYQWALPTESQWEYACRAGTNTAFCNGANLDKTDDAALQRKIDDISWYSLNKPSATAQIVGQKKPNAWGLYDMHGNVWEWCRDWYGAYPSGSVSDPSGPLSGTYRCFRGGSWAITARYCRSAFRYNSTPSNYSPALGFRLALVPSTS